MGNRTQLTQRISESSAQADELRERARELLVSAVVDGVQEGFTQSEIARALGRSQPEVSRLLHSAPPFFRPRSPLGKLLIEKKWEVLHLVNEAGCENTRVFGSLARGEDTVESDIDLLVDIPDDFTLFRLARLQRRVQELFDVHVDVIPARGLKGLIRSTALRDAVQL